MAGIIFFVGVSFWAMALIGRGVHRDVFAQICDLVSNKFYKVDEDFSAWVEKCHERATSVSALASRDSLMKQIQWQLDELQVSHLSIYDPAEDRRLWRGESLDTGLRGRWIDGHVIVIRVIPTSVAAQGGVRRGDEIVTIDNEPPRSMWQLQSTSGYYQVRRAEGEFRIYLEPRVLTIDRSPQLIPLSSSEAVLEISSFRGEYFQAKPWSELTGQLANLRHVIVDLRDNSGGNLVAMLRGLSPFFCHRRPMTSMIWVRSPIWKSSAIFH